MREVSQRVIDAVSGWDGITAHPHRFGGVEFKLGSVEIGHVHVGNGLIDIPFTLATREALVAAGDAEPHHILPESGWISYWMHGSEDADQAMRLLRLSYLHKRSRRERIVPQAELDSLHFSRAVIDSLGHHEAPEGE